MYVYALTGYLDWNDWGDCHSNIDIGLHNNTVRLG